MGLKSAIKNTLDTPEFKKKVEEAEKKYKEEHRKPIIREVKPIPEGLDRLSAYIGESGFNGIYDYSTYGTEYPNYIDISVPHIIKPIDELGNHVGSMSPFKGRHGLDRESPLSSTGSCELVTVCTPTINVPDKTKKLADDIIGEESITLKTIEDIRRIADKIKHIPEPHTLITILSDLYKHLPEPVRHILADELKNIPIPAKEPDYKDLSAYHEADFPKIDIEKYEESDELKKLLDELSKLKLEPMDIPILCASNEDLTTRATDGSGVFDHLALALKNQLDSLISDGLITKDAFSNIYTQGLLQVIPTASQYALERKTIQQQSYTNRIQAMQASVAVLQAKANLLMLPSQLKLAYAQIEAQYKQIELLQVQIQLEKEKYPQVIAQTDLILAQTDGQRLSNEQAQTSIQTAKMNLSLVQEQYKQAQIVTQNEELKIEQTMEQTKQFKLANNKLIEDTKLVDAQTQTTLKQVKLIDLQALEAEARINALAQQLEKEKENTALLKAQVATTFAQLSMVQEQIKGAKAQYSDTIDGVPIGGVLGGQIKVNKAQADGFERRAFNDYVSLIQQGWVTKKTADIATLSPNSFTGLSLDKIFNWYGKQYFNLPNDVFKLPIGYSDYLTDEQMDGEAPASTETNLATGTVNSDGTTTDNSTNNYRSTSNPRIKLTETDIPVIDGVVRPDLATDSAINIEDLERRLGWK